MANLDNRQSFNLLNETLQSLLHQAPDKSSVAELVSVIEKSSAHSHLSELNKTLNANNVNQTITMFGQQLGEVIAQNTNQDEIKVLTETLSQAIANNDIKQQLTQLVQAWSGKQ